MAARLFSLHYADVRYTSTNIPQINNVNVTFSGIRENTSCMHQSFFLFFFFNFFLSFTLHRLNRFTFTILFSFVNDHTHKLVRVYRYTRYRYVRVRLRIVKKKKKDSHYAPMWHAFDRTGMVLRFPDTLIRLVHVHFYRCIISGIIARIVKIRLRKPCRKHFN